VLVIVGVTVKVGVTVGVWVGVLVIVGVFVVVGVDVMVGVGVTTTTFNFPHFALLRVCKLSTKTVASNEPNVSYTCGTLIKYPLSLFQLKTPDLNT
jgi:hypothetical protein